MPANTDAIGAVTTTTHASFLPTTDDLLSAAGLDTFTLMLKLVAANLIAIWIYHNVVK